MVYGIAYSPLVYKDELKAMGFAGNTALIEPVSIARSQLSFTAPFHHCLYDCRTTKLRDNMLAGHSVIIHFYINNRYTYIVYTVVLVYPLFRFKNFI